MAGEPELAQICIVEVLAAGPRAIARRDAAMRMFAEIIEDNIREQARRRRVTVVSRVNYIHVL